MVWIYILGRLRHSRRFPVWCRFWFKKWENEWWVMASACAECGYIFFVLLLLLFLCSLSVFCPFAVTLDALAENNHYDGRFINRSNPPYTLAPDDLFCFLSRKRIEMKIFFQTPQQRKNVHRFTRNTRLRAFWVFFVLCNRILLWRNLNIFLSTILIYSVEKGRFNCMRQLNRFALLKCMEMKWMTVAGREFRLFFTVRNIYENWWIRSGGI